MPSASHSAAWFLASSRSMVGSYSSHAVTTSTRASRSSCDVERVGQQLACVSARLHARRRCAPGPDRGSTSRARRRPGTRRGWPGGRRPAPRRLDPVVGRAAHHHEPPAPRGRQDTRDAGPDDQLGGDLATGGEITSECRRLLQDRACLGLERGPRHDRYQVFRHVPGPDVDQMEGVVATDGLVDGVPERSSAAGLPIDGNDDRTAVSCAHRTSFRWLPPSTVRLSRRVTEPKVTQGWDVRLVRGEEARSSRVTLRGLSHAVARGADAPPAAASRTPRPGPHPGRARPDTAHGAALEALGSDAAPAATPTPAAPRPPPAGLRRRIGR